MLPKSKAWDEVPNPTICMDLNPNTLSPVKIEQVPDPDIQVQLWAKIIALDMRDSAPFSFFNRTSFQPALGAPNLFVELGLANVSESVKVERVIGHEVVDSKWGGEQMVVDIPHGAVVELIINNGDEMPHPFHLVSIRYSDFSFYGC
jgi:FtsP/CotA-like multicopper oxidase with cupredoxin domain